MLSFSFINLIRLILRAVSTCEWRLKGFNYLYQNIYMSGNKAIILKDYEFCQQNGNFVQINYGSYGSVRLAKCMKTGTIVAIKTIYGILVKREIQNHIEMSHKNVIKLIDYFIDEINISTWLIFQYPENGKLFHYFRTIKVLERALVYSILRTICEALEYLYYNGILLRQFNPDYIYINKKNNIKICGLEFDDTPEQKIHRKIPLEYMAPQLFKNQHFDQKIYSWGLGVIFYELVEGKTPFKANNFNQLMTQIQKPFNLTNFRFEQMELINKTLKLDPKQRFRLNELLTKTILNQAFAQCLGKSGYIIKNSQIKVAQKHMQSKIKITQSLKGQDRAKRSQKKQVKHGIESRIKITQISQISECPEQAQNLKVNMSQGEIVGNNTAQTTKNSIQIIGINNLEFNETSNIQITGIKNTMDPNKSSHLIPVNPGTLGQTTNIFDKLREQKKCLLAIGQSKQKISLRQLKIKKQDFKLVKPT